jgi:hypothetical protein
MFLQAFKNIDDLLTKGIAAVKSGIIQQARFTRFGVQIVQLTSVLFQL